MKKRYEISEGRVIEGRSEESQIIFYINPDAEETRYLIEQLQIDEHTLNSALDPDELPRLEFEPQHVAMILKRPRSYSGEEEFLLRVTSMGLFLFKDRLILVSSDPSDLFDGRAFAKVLSLNHFVLKIFHQTISHFLGHLRVISMISDSLEQKINASMENKYLLNLFTLEKSLVYYLNAINANGVLIERIKNNSAKIGFAAEEMEFLDDMLVDNTQCYKQAEIYSNVLSGLMDARASIVNNNLNVLMKRLNLITIGIMVPTLVVSIFSMNVAIPLQHNPSAFLMIMGLALASVVALLVVWWRKKF